MESQAKCPITDSPNTLFCEGMSTVSRPAGEGSLASRDSRSDENSKGSACGPGSTASREGLMSPHDSPRDD